MRYPIQPRLPGCREVNASILKLACQAVASSRWWWRGWGRLRTFGDSGVTAFALATRRAKTGGEGTRTPVLNAHCATFYMHRRFLISEECCESPHHIPPSGHVFEFTGSSGRPTSRPACCIRIHPQQASGQTRHGNLGRESEIFVICVYFCLIRFFTRPTNHPRHAGLH